MEGQSEFRVAGGQEFQFIPCLNDADYWIAGLAEIALQHLQGWPLRQPHPHELEARRSRAQTRGAAA
ncbi:ferrochelatase [compost metagenome]